MRIIHFSDLHLKHGENEKTLRYVINPLIVTLKEQNEITKIDLILFTGDLVDKGGIGFKNLTEAFFNFHDNVMKPICKSINLDENRFIICPGNHDIKRDLDNEHLEKGLSLNLNSEEAVADFIKKNRNNNIKEGIERIKDFKEFEELIYSSDNYKFSYFESLFTFSIENEKVGIASLNSSWRCFSDDDDGNLLLGIDQLINATNYLNDCKFKIVLSHHHYDAFKPFEKDNVEKIIQKDFDLYLSGHVHSAKNKYIIDPTGKVLSLIAPGTLSDNVSTDSKKHTNGFSIIDVDFSENNVEISFYSYHFPNSNFNLNDTIAKNGKWNIDLPKTEEVEKKLRKKELIDSIKSEYLPKIDSHLLTYSTDTDAPKCLNDIFVKPKLVIKEDIKDDKEIIVEDLLDIIKDEKNYIIFGVKESGKTILLDKILIDCLDPKNNIKYIPIFLEFSKISTDILTNIRDFLLSSKANTKEALQNFPVLLLVDNLLVTNNYSELSKISQLNQLNEEFENLKIISTYNTLYENHIPEYYSILNKLKFNTINIKDFHSKQIRELTNKWFHNSDIIEKPKKIETLINGFLALSLPRTPFTVSMFLWIIEKQEHFRPINNSTLIETFIEKLLNKHSKSELLSEKFDYQNKVRLLADLAFEMLEGENENYELSQANVFNFINSYFSRKEFDYNVEKTINDLVNVGIFVKDNNNIRFRFNCFFEYFLVKKMFFDPKFKDKVLDEKNYLKYQNEIDYYTGLNRDCTDILKLITKRLDENLKSLVKKIDSLEASIDDFFLQKVSRINIPEDKVANIIPDLKATEDDFEKIEDEMLSSNKPESGVKKKESLLYLDSISMNLILAMKVLKNSEEIEEVNLKFNSYSSILKNSIYFAIFYKIYISLLIEKKLMPEKEKEEQLEILQFLPCHHVDLLNRNMGTQKLAQTISKKIESDLKNKNVSEFEKFISVFLYADLKGKNYFEKLFEFIKNANKKYILDMSFLKVMGLYTYKSKNPDSDLKYLNMIGDLLIKAKGYRKESKSDLMNNYKAKRNNSDS